MWRTEVTGDQITDKLINSVSEDMMCDALILDEAHNIFKPEAEIIHLLVKPDSYLYVFGDKAQRFRTLNFKTAIDFYDYLPKQTLNIKCRNTKEIESVLPQLETQSLGNLGTSGPKPEMYCAEEKVLLSHVPQVFAKVIKEFGVTAEEVTLITGEVGLEKLQDLKLKTKFGAEKLNATSPVWFQAMESKIVIALISLDLFKYEISFWDYQNWIEWAMTRDNVSQNAVIEYQIVKEDFREFCEQHWSRVLAEDGTGVFDFKKTHH